MQPLQLGGEHMTNDGRHMSTTRKRHCGKGSNVSSHSKKGRSAWDSHPDAAVAAQPEINEHERRNMFGRAMHVGAVARFFFVIEPALTEVRTPPVAALKFWSQFRIKSASARTKWSTRGRMKPRTCRT